MRKGRSEKLELDDQDHYLLASSVVSFNLDSPHQVWDHGTIVLTWENTNQEKWHAEKQI